MVLKILAVLTLISCYVHGHRYSCTEKSALQLLKRPAYDFSMKILERVAHNTNGHFIYSPFSTWVQLKALAEGAKGRTLTELRQYTQNHRQACFKQKFANVVRRMNHELKDVYGRRSVFVTDELMNSSRRYIMDMKRYYNVRVMPVNFDFPQSAARKVNNFLFRGPSSDADKLVFPDDFQYTVMLLCDNVFLKSAWKYPFDPVFTTKQNFTSIRGTISVNMMSTTGYFNTTELRFINAKVVEIPCTGDLSMLILMPLTERWIGDVFYYLQQTNLYSIFNRFRAEREKLVTVKLPRFRIESMTENLPELLYDMGIREVFDPVSSELPYVTVYPTFPAVMAQLADVEVIESGVTANASPAPLAKDAKSIEFTADRPFAYLLVNRKTQFVLFGGAYSNPTVY